jgi:hypothetical protein
MTTEDKPSEDQTLRFYLSEVASASADVERTFVSLKAAYFLDGDVGVRYSTFPC